MTTLPHGTDIQVFCEDDLSRLTWAGTTGTPPCLPTLLQGSFIAASYHASYTYDAGNRLRSGPLGNYTYGANTHVSAATAIGGTAWTASYDASGNMTCRAPSSASTCSGTTPTGAQLTYDNAGQLATWQNAPSSPTSTDSFLYDGEGHRVAQVATTSGTTTTTTSYVGTLEEISVTSATTTTTAYYSGIAESVNGALSYTLADHLGSVSAALSTSGAVAATQLYGPYGAVRYSNGTLPGTRAYTGQRADAATGLDYYDARYYDPVAGQFTSADTVLTTKKDAIPAPSQLNRYAYVAGNPETRTDPTGHRYVCPTGECGGSGNGGNGGNGNGGNGTNLVPGDGGPCTDLPSCTHFINGGVFDKYPNAGCKATEKYCFIGSAPNGLLQFSSLPEGVNAAGVIVNGKPGIEWLIQFLNDLRSNMNDAVTKEEGDLALAAGLTTGALTVILGLIGTAMEPGAGTAGGIEAALQGGALISGILYGNTLHGLVSAQSEMNTAITNLQAQLRAIDDAMSTPANAKTNFAVDVVLTTRSGNSADEPSWSASQLSVVYWYTWK